MKKLNDLTITAIARVDAALVALKDEEGSEVAQAAGVAMVAAAVIGAMLTATSGFAGKVTGVFTRLVGLIN